MSPDFLSQPKITIICELINLFVSMELEKKKKEKKLLSKFSGRLQITSPHAGSLIAGFQLPEL